MDLSPIKDDILRIIKNPEADDGSYGPLLVRLAWHASGTYDKATNTGGSNGSTMRFQPESTDGANAGLETARLLLEPLTAKYPKISRADIWTLAGAVAIESMGCPAVAWRPGRVDFNPSDNTGATSGKCPVSGKSVGKCPASGNVGGSSGGFIPPNGRLPDAALGAAHLRTVFNRMGFNDQEIVALSGAHSLGRCHTDRSGYSGPWTYTPNKLGNQYFKLLLSVKWQKKKWDGPEQFVDPTDSIMMLPTDMCLLSDPDFKKHVQLYADNKDAFLKDFSRVFAKLMELGVPRPRI